jgi:antitoxin (DNA-binding transcriptional repressor) of toxin-antitoxin stability system
MTTISLLDAQSQLSDLVHNLAPGAEVIITEDDRPVARLLSATQERPTPQFGTMRGTVLYMADDFDAPLEGFGDDD